MRPFAPPSDASSGGRKRLTSRRRAASKCRLRRDVDRGNELEASDGDVLAAARRDARILITEDRDFGEMIVRQRLRVHGVVLLELDRLSSAAEARYVAAVVSANTEKLAGNLIVIEPGRIRVWPDAVGQSYHAGARRAVAAAVVWRRLAAHGRTPFRAPRSWPRDNYRVSSR